MISYRTCFNDPPPPVVPPPPPPPAPPPAKLFTQDEVNAMMAANKKALQAANAEQIKQLEELRAKVNLTQQEKDELDSRIQTLSQQHLTKEQQLAADLERERKKAKTEIDATTAQAARWKSEFESGLIRTAIVTGATEHKAASLKQMELMLRGQAKVVEVLDDTGKPNGFAVKIPTTVIDPKTKEPIVVDMDAVEAIGAMRNNADFANLFIFDGKPGIGGTTTNGKPDAPIDYSKIKPEEYAKRRKELGLKGN